MAIEQPRAVLRIYEQRNKACDEVTAKLIDRSEPSQAETLFLVCVCVCPWRLSSRFAWTTTKPSALRQQCSRRYLYSYPSVQIGSKPPAADVTHLRLAFHPSPSIKISYSLRLHLAGCAAQVELWEIVNDLHGMTHFIF